MIYSQEVVENGRNGIVHVGVIGAGVAASFHVTALKRLVNIKIFIYDIQYEQACNLSRKFGCIPVANFEALMNIVDAIIVATPSKSHCEIVLDAVQQGKHILCEKPMASNLKDALRMYDEYRSSNLVCAIGFNYRFLGISNVLKGSKLIGHIQSIKIVIKRLFREEEHWKGESVLSDLGIHLIDYVMFVSDSPIDYDTCIVNFKRNNNVDYYSSVKGYTYNRLRFDISMSRVESADDVFFAIEVDGIDGHLVYESHSPNVYTIDDSEGNTVYALSTPPLNNDFFNFAESIYCQDKDWIGLICGQTSSSIASFYHGMIAQEALDYFLTL